MKVAAPWTDENYLRSVWIVPDFEPVPESQQYQTLVLLGPEPLTWWEMLCACSVVGLCLISACSVVAVLWWLVKLI